MLSLCMFPLFLIVGYFLIDKKTQKDILKKIKGNQMVVFGGLILVYFLFVRNNVEGHAVLNGLTHENSDTTFEGRQALFATEEARRGHCPGLETDTLNATIQIMADAQNVILETSSSEDDEAAKARAGAIETLKDVGVLVGDWQPADQRDDAECYSCFRDLYPTRGILSQADVETWKENAAQCI